MLEGEHIPYINSENEPLDFEKKRLEFWLETVPPDVRRIEYDLWRRFRTLTHAELFRRSKSETLRPISLPPFTAEEQGKYWQAFVDSFLHGQARQERFAEIVTQVQQDKDRIVSLLPDEIQSKIKMIAVSGSSVYGPRQPFSPLSDIDVSFLLDTREEGINFDMYPGLIKEDEHPYHYFGTGLSDNTRGNRAIHWLLYPHYPIHNEFSGESIREIIADLITDTRGRLSELEREIEELDEQIEHESKPGAHGYTK